MQLDLFSAPPAAPARWWLGEGDEAQAQQLGWESRCLADMATGDGTLTYCFPGFMGAVCERLVAKGLATKEPAGFLDPPAGVKPATLKQWGWRREDHPLFRYALTDRGSVEAAPPTLTRLDP